MRSARFIRIALVAAGVVLVATTGAIAGSGAIRVGLAVSANDLQTGAATKLTATARLPRGTRLSIQSVSAGGPSKKLIECAKSPCVASYRSTQERGVDFQASVVKHVGRKVTTLGRSARVSVFWSDPAPPPPPPPPPPAAVPGHYEGHTQDNEVFGFDVSADGARITGLFTGAINQSCNPPDYYIHGGNLSGWAGPVARDGTFAMGYDGPTTVGGEPATKKVRVTGTVANGTATGTIRVDLSWTHNGTGYSCTNGDQTWSASKV